MKQYSTCTACGQEMAPGNACTLEAYNNEPPRIPFQLEDYDGICHDCNAPTGGLHHPGCDAERCPMCLGQAISCACNDEDEPELEGIDYP